jgi:hypothetical protein
LQLEQHLFKSLKSNELFALTRPSLQPVDHGLEQDSNFRFLLRKMLLTRPSLQLRFCIGFCGIAGVGGCAAHTSGYVLSSFASSRDCGSARLSGSPVYCPGNLNHLQACDVASKSFWHVDTQFFRNSVGF